MYSVDMLEKRMIHVQGVMEKDDMRFLYATHNDM